MVGGYNSLRKNTYLLDWTSNKVALEYFIINDCLLFVPSRQDDVESPFIYYGAFIQR